MQNSVVYLGTVPANSLNIEVTVPGVQVGSAWIFLTGALTRTVLENGVLALCGNTGPDYSPCDQMTVGKYNISADVYSGFSASGQLVASSSISFELTNDMIPGPVPNPTASPNLSPTAPKFSPTKQPVVASTSAPVGECKIPKVSSRTCSKNLTAT
jgi:hypothetical protein